MYYIKPKEINTVEIKKINMLRNDKEISAYLTIINTDDYENIKNTPEKILNRDELNLFYSYKFDIRKKSYLSGRYAGKTAIAQMTNENDYTKIEIASGTFGQPVVKYAVFDEPSVSISHTKDKAFGLAFPKEHPMGIDIEVLKADNDKIETIKSQLTGKEIKIVKDSYLEDNTGFITLWTMKEALSKVLRCGLTTPFRILEIHNAEISPYETINTFYKYFEQYRCYTYFSEGYSISITMPKFTSIINNPF